MWDQAKAAQLREFFAREVGQEFITDLKSQIPRLDGSSIEARAITASEKEGAEIILRRIEELKTWEEPASTQTPYIEDIENP